MIAKTSVLYWEVIVVSNETEKKIIIGSLQSHREILVGFLICVGRRPLKVIIWWCLVTADWISISQGEA